VLAPPAAIKLKPIGGPDEFRNAGPDFFKSSDANDKEVQRICRGRKSERAASIFWVWMLIDALMYTT
jgi:hypothetical protein